MEKQNLPYHGKLSNYGNSRISILTVTIFFAVVFCSITESPVQARVLTVPDNFETIQSAIDSSVSNDTVFVRPGVYVESVNFTGKRITVASQYIYSGDKTDVDRTIIDGGNDGHVVVFMSEERRYSTLTGFTLRNGRAIQGGGIYCRGASPTLSDLRITNNFSVEEGGGVYCFGNADPLLENVEIVNNQAEGNGGGFYCREGCDPTLREVVISRNTASSGGGVYINRESNLILENSTVIDNFASSLGGGIACIANSSANLFRVVIGGNSAESLYAGGVYVGASNMELENVTIANNSTEGRGGGLYLAGDSRVIFHNTILWNNNPDGAFSSGSPQTPGEMRIRYCDVHDGRDGIVVLGNTIVNWGEGNISADPLFVNPRDYDYHIRADSPCRDAGDPGSHDDPDGSRADIGALWFSETGIPSADSKNAPRDLDMLSIYPNPFNSEVFINCTVPAPGNYQLSVYAPDGREIYKIDRSFSAPRVYTVRFVNPDLRSGVYIARFTSKNLAVCKKFICLR